MQSETDEFEKNKKCANNLGGRVKEKGGGAIPTFFDFLYRLRCFFTPSISRKYKCLQERKEKISSENESDRLG